MMVILVLCAGQNVIPTMAGAWQEQQINVMTVSKYLPPTIPACAETPPSGEMSPAPSTTRVVVLLPGGCGAPGHYRVVPTPGTSAASIIMRQVLWS